MAKKKHSFPCMPFWCDDYLGSPTVLAMTPREELAYLRLLVIGWQPGSLPMDRATLERMGRFNEEWSAGDFENVLDNFVEEGGRYINEKSTKEREKSVAYRDAQSRRGKSGNESRWGDDGSRTGSPTRSPEVSPEHRSPSPSPSPSSPPTPKKKRVDHPSGDPLASFPPVPDSDVPHPYTFDTFWSLYPRKVDKIPARKKWNTLVKDGETAFTVIGGLMDELDWRNWAPKNGHFVPEWKHPKTWLSHASWDNEHDYTPRTHEDALRRDEKSQQGRALTAAKRSPSGPSGAFQ